MFSFLLVGRFVESTEAPEAQDGVSVGGEVERTETGDMCWAATGFMTNWADWYRSKTAVLLWRTEDLVIEQFE